MKKSVWVAIISGCIWGGAALGEVVYTDVNPDVVLNQGNLYTFDLPDTSDSTDFDLHYIYNENWDIRMRSFTPSGSAAGGSPGGSDVFKLGQGSVIGSSITYISDVGAKILWRDYGGAPWNGDGSSGFAGFRILSDTPGSYYYGWVRLTIDPTTGQIVIYDWAYENTLDTAIEAGKTGLPDETVITSLSSNGEIIWTNDVTSVNYKVQWADNLAGPWRGSWYENEKIAGETNLSFTAKVPMFYRVTTGEWNLTGVWDFYIYTGGTNLSPDSVVSFYQSGNTFTGVVDVLSGIPLTGAVRGDSMGFEFDLSGIQSISVGSIIESNRIEGFRHAAMNYSEWRAVKR